MTRLLLLGRNGQLGWELQRSLAPLGELVALDRLGTPATDRGDGVLGVSLCGDLGQPDALRDTVRALKPDVIVNAAAYTAVERAESEPELARAINSLGPGMLARTSAELDAFLIHYGTDYVFDGTGSGAWREDDATGPLGVYGLTKLEGECQIRHSGCRHLILRTSWVYATRGDNFPRTVLRLAAQRDALNVVGDQIGAPTGAELLADVTAHALRAVVREPGLAGTYHVAASGETSRFDYASYVVNGARARGLTLRLAPEGLARVPTSNYRTVARYPLNSRLDCHRFEQAFGLRMPSWTHGVERFLDELGQLAEPSGNT